MKMSSMRNISDQVMYQENDHKINWQSKYSRFVGSKFVAIPQHFNITVNMDLLGLDIKSIVYN